MDSIKAIKDLLDKYSSSNADWFSLKDDEDLATVKFLHHDEKDLDILVVHKVKIGGKDRYIECTQEKFGKCAFCNHGWSPTVRGFFQLFDGRDSKRKLWDRGKNEITSIIGYLGRYGSLDDREYDIQRQGKKGDNDTKYQFFPGDKGEFKLQIPANMVKDEIKGPDKFVLVKSFEEMQAMIDNGEVQQSVGIYGATAQKGGATKMF